MGAILAQQRPSATTNTTLYTVPAAYKAAVNIKAINTSTTASAIRIGIQTASGAVSNIDYVVYDYSLPGDGLPLILTGEILPASTNVFVYTANATVNFHLSGQLEPA